MQPLAPPLQQSPEYARAITALGGVAEFVRTRSLACLTQSRAWPGLGRVSLISRGPLGDDAARHDWLSERHGTLVLNAEGFDAGTLRRAGFWPLLSPASLAILDLGDRNSMRHAMHQKWRNRLNRAQSQPLTVTRRALGHDDWLLRAETQQARRRGYRSLPARFLQAYAAGNPGRALVWEARDRDGPVAAALVLRHQRAATWQIGTSTARGRSMSAMNRVLWQAMIELAEDGAGTLDLGLVCTENPGLARFKLGTGARLHTLSGTWLHHPALAPVARRLPARLAA
ncbi:GNAT family N-acetyltransferase [Thalassococcus sp. CAU 1522]|uniref:GNAT family N-acetyltransferase n=1 Tax=Thalassococcus arenae TaxID=2851652 RepID=A0ABS6N951_9RHOB|nr:GNAT family N-acetyltransferase [Thalassococcus arenae]MBV2360536.1 GNAT family N-acetyltransferase [Thalassococcus arenae]